MTVTFSIHSTFHGARKLINAPGAFKHTDKLSKHNATLETEEEVLEGAEKVKFVAFMRRMLQWRPEDRPSASELLEDPWLRFPEPDEENK
jgi:serine/threonine protein kinase